jgi:hypothetical protein
MLDMPGESCKVPILWKITHDGRVRIESGLKSELAIRSIRRGRYTGVGTTQGGKPLADRPPPTDTLLLPSHARGAVLRCDSDLVGVLVERDHRCLIAIHPIAVGTRLFALTGRETPRPTRYSVQVGRSLHLDPDCVSDELELVRRYFWRYLDHHCDPTTVIRDREVLAIRDIAEGHGVTFNYNTTEYDMAEPFRCQCGSASCVGMVRGARHLTPAQRAQVARWLPEYLL